ncbi:MAG: PQQ-binding-like beta-propeller repeat protein [Acidobacteriota bacterium]
MSHHPSHSRERAVQRRSSLSILVWVTLTALLLLLAVSAAQGEEPTGSTEVVPASLTSLSETALWPQWRGPERDGSVSGAAWPASLEGIDLSWDVQELGPSYSGPIVAEDRVFITETVDKAEEVVTALDRKTGQVLWRQQWKGSMSVPFFAAKNGSWIRSTPAYDGESLYVGGIREVLVRLDAYTGSVVWKVDFPERYGTPMPDFGYVASPLVTEDAVYVQAANSMLKLNKETGETIWRSLQTDESIMVNGAFSSPVLAQLGGEEQLVVQTRTHLAGVSPGDGSVLWTQEVPSFRGMNILTPTVIGDRVVTSSYRNATWAYQVSESEVSTAWQSKVQGYMSSPLVIDDYVYLHLGNGRLTCIHWKTGEQAWTTEPLGKYWSMARQGERVLALNEKGELLLFDASPEGFEILDRQTVSDQETWAHIAVAGEEVFVRELRGLKKLSWKAEEMPTLQSAATVAGE